MADVYVNALTTLSSEPTSTDSIVCVNRNTNEGQIIDYSLLTDVILSKISSKTFSSLTTTSKLLTGAINELDADVASLNSSLAGKMANTSGSYSVSLVSDSDYVAMEFRLNSTNFFRLVFYDSGKVSIIRRNSSGWMAETVLRNAD